MHVISAERDIFIAISYFSLFFITLRTFQYFHLISFRVLPALLFPSFFVSFSSHYFFLFYSFLLNHVFIMGLVRYLTINVLMVVVSRYSLK